MRLTSINSLNGVNIKNALFVSWAFQRDPICIYFAEKHVQQNIPSPSPLINCQPSPSATESINFFYWVNLQMHYLSRELSNHTQFAYTLKRNILGQNISSPSLFVTVTVTRWQCCSTNDVRSQPRLTLTTLNTNHVQPQTTFDLDHVDYQPRSTSNHCLIINHVDCDQVRSSIRLTETMFNHQSQFTVTMFR